MHSNCSTDLGVIEATHLVKENDVWCLCRPSFVAQLLMTSCWTPVWEWWGCGLTRQVASAASECCSLLLQTVSSSLRLSLILRSLHLECNSDLLWLLANTAGSMKMHAILLDIKMLQNFTDSNWKAFPHVREKFCAAVIWKTAALFWS